MPIVAKAGTDFRPAPAGAYAAVCCDIVDLGNLEVTYSGKTQIKHKVRIVWQIEEERDDGKPFTVRKQYTLSLHEKSALRKDLESWRGRPFTEAELGGFDLENLLSVGAFLNVIHEQKNGQTYANVTSIMRMPKSMTAPTVRDYVRVCDREPADTAHGAPDADGLGITDEDVPF